MINKIIPRTLAKTIISTVAITAPIATPVVMVSKCSNDKEAIISDYNNNPIPEEDIKLWQEIFKLPIRQVPKDIFYSSYVYHDLGRAKQRTGEQLERLKSSEPPYPSPSYWKNIIGQMKSKYNSEKELAENFYNVYKIQDSIRAEKVKKILDSDYWQNFLSAQKKEKRQFLTKNPNYREIDFKIFRLDTNFPYTSIESLRSDCEDTKQEPYVFINHKYFNRRYESYQGYKGMQGRVVSDRRVEITRPYLDIHAFYNTEEIDGMKFLKCVYYGKENKNIIDEGYTEYAYKYGLDGYSRRKPYRYDANPGSF